MPTLYVLEPDARLEKEYGRLLVTREDEVLVRVPLNNVNAVVLVGYAGATTQALYALLGQGTPLFFVRHNGELLGQLQPAAGFNLPLRQAQYRRNDEAEFSLAFAKQIVAGKIHNQAVLLKRLARRRKAETSEVCTRMERLEQAALACAAMDSLLGVEGAAANAYFQVYQEAFDPSWKFTKRTRRPPKDPVNALLSLGYTFLGHAMTAALQIVGLDPYLGYFHQEAYGRPALALDLIEEFRAPLVDSLVMTLLNKRLLQAGDFESGMGGGIYLTRRGMRVFVREFSDRLESTVTVRSIGKPLSYRKLFEVQARSAAKFILGEIPAYRPFRVR